MKYLSFLFCFSFFFLFLTNCENPSGSNSNEVETEQKTLTYSIVEYANFPNQQPTVQVIYTNLENDLVVDSVQVPWSKSFDYEYSSEAEEFKTNFIVEYKGEKNVALRASINADESDFNTGIGNSLIIEVSNTLKLIK